MISFWKKKRVLITGFEGFLGSNLSKRILRAGANLVGLDIKINRKETIFTANEYKKITGFKGNVANYNLLEEIIKKYDIEVIFHLAAEAIVGRSVSSPLRTFSSNIRGTWNILEACRNVKSIKAVIIASSDKAYGAHKRLPYKEEAPLKAAAPYDVSKSCADLLAQTYFSTYDLPVAITRCGNIYGPGDFNFSRIIPDALRCAFSGRTLLIRSDGKYVRDYIYVEDILDGYLLLARNLEQLRFKGEAFNFSNENPVSVLDLIAVIRSHLDKSLQYKILKDAKYEIKRQYLSSQKARKVLGWRAKYGLQEGIERTVCWYKNYFAHKNR